MLTENDAMRNEFLPVPAQVRSLGAAQGVEDVEAYEDEAPQQQPRELQAAERVNVSTRMEAVKQVSVWKLPPAHFAKQARDDVATIKSQRAILETGVPYSDSGRIRFASVAQRMEAIRPLLDRPPTEPYTIDEENRVRAVFADLLRSLTTLDQVGKRYDNYYLHPAHDGFAPGNAIYRGATALAQKHAIKFYNAVGGNELLSRMLDEGNTAAGLPPGSFTKLEARVGEFSSALELRAAQTIARRAHVDEAAAKNPGLGFVAKEYRAWLREATEKNHAMVTAGLDGVGILTAARASARKTKRGVLAWLNEKLVKPIATWFGDTRMGAATAKAVLASKFAPDADATKKWDGERMVKPAQIKQLIPKLEPGDIGVVRQDWYLSNLKLPGHWPHTILHIGAPKELAAYFDNDAGVSAMVSKKTGGRLTKFSEYLQVTYPEKWKEYLSPDEHGQERRVIEAISEGVSITGPSHAFFVDYMGVMRPRVSKEDKAVAIERAFGMAGLPYDFNFDFATGNSIVCSELVYRAYKRGDGMEKGLSLPLTRVPDLGGRYTMPSEVFVETFDKEHGQASRQLDFVAYLQGDSKTQTARFASEAEFQKSHELPQYDWQVPEAIEKLRKQAAERVKLAQPWKA